MPPPNLPQLPQEPLRQPLLPQPPNNPPPLLHLPPPPLLPSPHPLPPPLRLPPQPLQLPHLPLPLPLLFRKPIKPHPLTPNLRSSIIMRLPRRRKTAIAFLRQLRHLGGDGDVGVESGGLDGVAFDDVGGGGGARGEGFELGCGVGGCVAAAEGAVAVGAGDAAEAAEFVFVVDEGFGTAVSVAG